MTKRDYSLLGPDARRAVAEIEDLGLKPASYERVMRLNALEVFSALEARLATRPQAR